VSVSGTPEAYVGVPGEASPGTALNAVTDNTGKATVIVTLGQMAGPALVVAKVAEFGYADTARFTVTPGQPFSLSTSPPDTALYAGASITPRVVATDRFRNPRSDAVTLKVLSGPATIHGAVVTANAIGRVMFTAAADGFLDTAYLSVVPPGRLAAAYGPGIVVFNTDGSNVDTIPVPVGTLVGTVKWAPNGQSFVIDLEQYGPCAGSNGSIRTVDLSGHIAVVDSSPYYGDIYPQYSRDGTWIYFSKYPWPGTNGTSGGIWRVHPDGTGEDSVAIPNSTWDQGGSSSPDGQLLAYAGIGPGAQSLRILSIGTGTVTNLNVPAYLPQWSPTGTQIANGGCGSSISVVNVDGSSNHIVSPPSDPYNPAIDWSPDSQWIVAEQGLDHIDRIINVASGLVLPLYWTSDFVSPTWAPTGSATGLSLPPTRKSIGRRSQSHERPRR
jgi:hypothetical protein